MLAYPTMIIIIEKNYKVQSYVNVLLIIHYNILVPKFYLISNDRPKFGNVPEFFNTNQLYNKISLVNFPCMLKCVLLTKEGAAWKM